jgi:hypothetical protein
MSGEVGEEAVRLVRMVELDGPVHIGILSRRLFGKW